MNDRNIVRFLFSKLNWTETWPKKEPGEIYRICHELTVEIKFYKQVLKNVIKRAFGSLNNIFQDKFNAAN